MNRKERKLRVIELTKKWVEIMYSDKGKATEWKSDELFELFKEFCKEESIDSPQEKSLREAILYKTEDVFKRARQIEEAKLKIKEM